jgi:beta-glucosidase
VATGVTSLGADFTWGAATAAFQVEGGWDADGKGPSNWDTLGHAGRISGGATGDIACDHYHRVEEDLGLMARLGLTSYRFSVSWPRVQPDGVGAFNPRGVAFYDRLLDGLLARGIAPALTAYHWDHPQSLEDRGGWLDRDTTARFADYVAGLGERFGDRVERWFTVNEPLSVMMSNLNGFRTTGPIDVDAALRIAHHLLLGHGLAVASLRAAAGTSSQIGLAVNLSGVRPASQSPEDLAAAARFEAYEDRLILDPILRGHYPAVKGRTVFDAPDGDMAVIAAPVDFLGVNWYAPAVVAAAPDAPFGYRRRLEARTPTNMLGWAVLPEALGPALAWLGASYENLPPVVISENGQPTPDAVDDSARIDYLSRCVEQVRAARAAGCDIRGYYVWSLLDNLEWDHGYGPRFGLVHVDYATLRRTPKRSYHWYRELIARERGVLA